MHFWSIKGVYFLQNANNLNFKLFFRLYTWPTKQIFCLYLRRILENARANMYWNTSFVSPAILSLVPPPRNTVSASAVMALIQQQTKEREMLTWHTLSQQIRSPLKDILIKPNWYYLAMCGMKFWRKKYIISLVVWYLQCLPPGEVSFIPYLNLPFISSVRYHAMPFITMQ